MIGTEVGYPHKEYQGLCDFFCFIPNNSFRGIFPLQAKPSLTKMRFRSPAERCMKMWKQVGLLIQT